MPTIKSELSETGEFKTFVSAKKTEFIERFIHLDGKPFSFVGRNYLRPIYNSSASRKLLMCGRQVEKCLDENSQVLDPSGLAKAIRDFKPGDGVLGYDFETGKQVKQKVVISESNGEKECVEVETRLGRSFICTLNHPLRMLNRWVRADELKVGDRIATLKTIGFFGKRHNDLAGAVGLLFGDGSFYESPKSHAKTISLCAANPAVIQWFDKLLVESGHGKPAFCERNDGSGVRSIRVRAHSQLWDWVVSNDLTGQRSHTKKLPDEVFQYDEWSTRELLRGLWATDGHCKRTDPSRFELTYCTTSPTLRDQVMLLMSKFGIVTKYREYQPKMENARLAYLIHVIGRRSVIRFHDRLGPIPGKDFSIENIPTEENSHRDCAPREILSWVAEERERRDMYHIRGAGDFNARLGFKMNPVYAQNWRKIEKVAEFLDSDRLRNFCKEELFWEEVVSIRPVGFRKTWAIQTENETFISDSVIHHNSTMLANEIIISSIIIPYYYTVYVSPSHSQSRQFSSSLDAHRLLSVPIPEAVIARLHPAFCRASPAAIRPVCRPRT